MRRKEERPQVQQVDIEEEELARVLEESRKMAYSCQFCGMVMEDMDSKQMHTLSCVEIELGLNNARRGS